MVDKLHLTPSRFRLNGMLAIEIVGRHRKTITTNVENLNQYGLVNMSHQTP